MASADVLTVFAVRSDGLRLLDRVPSGGDLPISVDVRARLVYVLNAGSSNITGFRLNDHGLRAIPDGTRGLSPGAAGPAQVGFTRDRTHLIVTLKGSNAIDTFPVMDNGRAGHAIQGNRVHQHDGALSPIGATEELPAGAVGLAAT